MENPLGSAGYNSYNGFNGAGVSASVLGLGASKVEVKKEGDVVMTFVDDLFSVCVNNSGAGGGGGGAGLISSGGGFGGGEGKDWGWRR